MRFSPRVMLKRNAESHRVFGPHALLTSEVVSFWFTSLYVCVLECETYSYGEMEGVRKSMDISEKQRKYSSRSLFTLYVSLGHSLPARSESAGDVSALTGCSVYIVYIYIYECELFASLGRSIRKKIYCM